MLKQYKLRRIIYKCECGNIVGDTSENIFIEIKSLLCNSGRHKSYTPLMWYDIRPGIFKGWICDLHFWNSYTSDCPLCESNEPPFDRALDAIK